MSSWDVTMNTGWDHWALCDSSKCQRCSPRDKNNLVWVPPPRVFTGAAMPMTYGGKTQKPSLNYTAKDNRVKWIEANNHFRSGDFGRARSAYTCALDGAAQKDLATILSNRAECYLRMGLKQQAKSDVEDALRLNPGHKKSQSRLKRCGGKTHTSCSDARAERDGGRCCLASMSLRLGERANSRGQTTSWVGEAHAH